VEGVVKVRHKDGAQAFNKKSGKFYKQTKTANRGKSARVTTNPQWGTREIHAKLAQKKKQKKCIRFKGVTIGHKVEVCKNPRKQKNQPNPEN